MEERKKEKKRSWWVFGAALLYLASKGKYILSILKFSKLGATLVSMFVTIGAYAIIFPIQFAIGLVVMILIHELGHVIAAKQKGLPVSAPLFIPFLGALITMKKHPRDAVTEAYIAFGGPVLGTVGALITFILGVLFNNHLLLVIAQIGFFLNLLNLLPIHPLDGGRISTAVTRWLWLVGLVGGLIVIIKLESILFFIIWALFAWELYQKYIKNGGGRKKRSATFTLTIPFEQLWYSGALIPGEDHKRELAFDTFSMLDGEQKLRVYWEGLGIDQTIGLPKGVQAIISKVHVINIEKKTQDDPPLLIVHCQIDYAVYEPDNYYDVPVQTRWNFGMVYVGLIILLAFMLYAVHLQGIPSLV